MNRGALEGDGLMAMEQGGKKVAYDMAKANPSLRRPSAARRSNTLRVD
jgi:hypothetical protein